VSGCAQSLDRSKKRLFFFTVWRKNDPVSTTILVWFIEFASQTAILFALVWIMIKFQKLDQHDKFHFLKVLGVAALSGGLDMIPYFGHYVSVSALLLGIKWATRSPYADVLFTVGISYALMFVVNLFIIGALMGDLRPSARDAGTPGQNESIREEPAVETEPETVAKTNRPALHPAPPVSAQPAPAGAGHLTIKGITRNAAKSVVIVDTGVKTYSLFLGDSLDLQTADGTRHLRFEILDADWVTLNIDGKPVIFPAR
jgi:hypothetical protein